MKNYNIYDPTGTFNVIVNTDTNTDNQDFIIAEILGLTPADIQAGFDFEQGDEISETDLEAFAENNNMVITKYVNGIEIGLENKLFGISNSEDTNVFFPVISIDYAPLVIEASIEAKLDDDLIIARSFGESLTLFGTNSLSVQVTPNFYLVLDPIGTGSYRPAVYYGANNVGDTLTFKSGWNKYKTIITVAPTALNLRLFVNGIKTGDQTYSESALSEPALEKMVIIGDPQNQAYHNGGLRNFKFTVNGVNYIDCPDPVTGINYGILGNGLTNKFTRG